MKLNFKFIFLTFCNLVFLNFLVTSNLAMHFFLPNAYLVILILGLFSSFLFLIMPKFKENFLGVFLKDKFICFISALYLIISSILILYIAFKVLSTKYFFETSTTVLMIVFFLSLFMITKASLKNLLKMKVLILLLLSFTSFILMINTNEKNFSLLFPFNFSLKKPYLLFGFLGLYLDSLFLIITSPKQNFSKFDFLLGTIFASILSCYFIVDNYSFVHFSYYKGLTFPALYRYKLYTGPKYIEHLDLLLNFVVSTYILLKVSFNLEIYRLVIKAKNSFFYRVFTNLFLFCIVYFCFNNFKYNTKIIYYLSAILSGLIFIVYLSLWRLKWKNIPYKTS